MAKRIGIVGIGAVGGYLAAQAAAKASAALHVTLFARGTTLSALRRGGLALVNATPEGNRVHVTQGDHVALVDSEDAKEVAASGKVDILFLVRKPFSLHTVLKQLNVRPRRPSPPHRRPSPRASRI